MQFVTICYSFQMKNTSRLPEQFHLAIVNFRNFILTTNNDQLEDFLANPFNSCSLKINMARSWNIDCNQVAKLQGGSSCYFDVLLLEIRKIVCRFKGRVEDRTPVFAWLWQNKNKSRENLRGGLASAVSFEMKSSFIIAESKQILSIVASSLSSPFEVKCSHPVEPLSFDSVFSSI